MTHNNIFILYMFPIGLMVQPKKCSKKMPIKLINHYEIEFKTKYPKQKQQSRRKTIRTNKTKKHK
jgi:hypothetical protein